mgnify:CR=1 FL=1
MSIKYSQLIRDSQIDELRPKLVLELNSLHERVVIIEDNSKQVNFFFEIPMKSVVYRGATEIFYIQETQVTSSIGIYHHKAVADYSTTFTETSRYTISAWFYKATWTTSWERYLRLSIDAEPS